MKRCFDPWRGLVISYNNRSWVNCCVYGGVSDVWEGTPDIAAMWNTPWFQKLREGMASGRVEKTGCHGCGMLKAGSVPQPEVAGGLTGIQRENAEQAALHWKNGDTVLESTPLELFLTFTPSCNLRCIMCSQEDIRTQEHTDLRADDILEQAGILERAQKVWVSGGEPLVSKECVKFIKAFTADKRFRSTTFAMVTNGQRLDAVLEDLDQLDKLDLFISSDGIGGAYEAVRRGGQWKKLSANIDAFLQVRDRQDRPGWSLSINYIIMRETLLCLPEFLEFVLSRGIEKLNFMGLDPTRETFDQDIYRNPEALAAIPDWPQALDRAASVCRRYGSEDLAVQLEERKKTLAAVTEVDRSVYASSNPLDLLNDEEVTGRNVLVWGTGGHYRIHFADWVRSNRDAAGQMRFVDNDESKWGSDIDGCRVLSPAEITDFHPDVIVLAVTRQFRDVIRDQISNDLHLQARVV